MNAMRQVGGEGDARGFTLIEMTIVLVIIALVMAGAMTSLSGLKQNADRAETAKSLEEIREALIGYVLTTGRLPCPATLTSNGSQVNGSSLCQQEVGLLPFADLGIKGMDAWGRSFTYHVDRNFASVTAAGGAANYDSTPTVCTPPTTVPTSAKFPLCADAGLKVQVSTGGTVTSVAAVVVAHGHDGAGAFQDDLRIEVSTSANQVENSDDLNDDGTVVASPDRTYADVDYSSVTDSEFDDQLTWIPSNVLKSKLVEAKKLP